ALPGIGWGKFRAMKDFFDDDLSLFDKGQLGVAASFGEDLIGAMKDGRAVRGERTGTKRGLPKTDDVRVDRFDLLLRQNNRPDFNARVAVRKDVVWKDQAGAEDFPLLELELVGVVFDAITAGNGEVNPHLIAFFHV